jgi:hypothetical protein
MDTGTSMITKTAPKLKPLPAEQMDTTTFIPMLDLYLVNRSTFVLRLDHEILFFKTIMVCNK